MYLFTKAKISTSKLLYAFVPGFMLAFARAYTDPRLTSMQFMNTIVAPGGFMFLAEVAQKVVKKLWNRETPEEPDSPEDVTDMDALMSTMFTLINLKMQPTMTDTLLDFGSTVQMFLFCKGQLAGAPILFHEENQPAQAQPAPRRIR